MSKRAPLSSMRNLAVRTVLRFSPQTLKSRRSGHSASGSPRRYTCEDCAHRSASTVFAGTWASSVRVGSKSIAPATSVIVRPAGIWPGQRIRNGRTQPPFIGASLSCLSSRHSSESCWARCRRSRPRWFPPAGPRASSFLQDAPDVPIDVLTHRKRGAGCGKVFLFGITISHRRIETVELPRKKLSST